MADDDLATAPLVINRNPNYLKFAVMVMIAGLVAGLVAITLFFHSQHQQIDASKNAADTQAAANAALIAAQDEILDLLLARQTSLSLVDQRILKALRGLHIRCSTVEGTTSTLKCVLIVPRIVIPAAPKVSPSPTPTPPRTKTPTPTCSPNPGGHCRPTPAPAGLWMVPMGAGGALLLGTLGFTYRARRRRR